MSALDMDTESALHMAIELIDRSGVAETDPDAAATVARLQQILDQKGCENFDPACADGKLTTLCDVIITG